MKKELYFKRWKEEITKYWITHKLQDNLIIYHIPKIKHPDGKEEFTAKEPFIQITKSNDQFFLAFYDADGKLSEAKEITAESLTKDHELAGFLLKTIHNDNNRKLINYKKFFKSTSLALLVGLGLGALIGLPLIFLNPFVALAVGLTTIAVAATVAYQAADEYFTPAEEILLPIEDIDTLQIPTEQPEYKKRWWQYVLTPVYALNSFGKLLGRIIVNNSIFKYTIGNIIAAIGNSGQNHYKVKPQNLTEILTALIFAGGAQKIQVEKDGHLNLGPILSEQFRAFKDFQQNYEENNFNEKCHVKVDNSTVITYYAANNYEQVENNGGQIPEIAIDEEHQKKINASKIATIYFCGNSSGGPQLAKSAVNDLNELAKPLAKIDEDTINTIKKHAKTEAEAQRIIDQFNSHLEPQATEAIIFSYPGVLNSSGKVSQAPDLLKSTVALVNELLKKGYKLENIQLDGMSLGGANEIQLAHHFHQRGGEFRGVYASRTFASTLAIGMSYVSKVPYVGKLLAALFAPFIFFGLWAVNWNMFSGWKFWSLDKNKTWSNTVYSPSDIRKNIRVLDDDILPTPNGGLYTAPTTRIQRNFERFVAFLTDLTNTWITGEETHQAMKKFKAKNVAHKTVVAQKVNDDFIHQPHIDGHSQVSHSARETESYCLLSRALKDGFHPREKSKPFTTKVADTEKAKFSTEKAYYHGLADNQRLRFLRSGGLDFNKEMDYLTDIVVSPAA